MTIKSNAPTSQKTSLIRTSDGDPSFPGLDRIGDRLAAGLDDLLSQLGCCDSIVRRDSTQLSDFGSWKDGRDHLLACAKLNLKPLKGGMLVVLSAGTIMQLVDLFYGGTGESPSERTAFTAAEERFITRFGEGTAAVLECAWSQVKPIIVSLANVETSRASLTLVKDKDRIVIQTFSIRSGPLHGAEFYCVYPVSTLRPIAELTQCSSPDEGSPVDAVWRAKLFDAVMEVRLPVRSVFARPELPLSQLLRLQPGEIIPICLPQSIPVTVAGRRFAMATLGEANGRAAICLEKIEKGNLSHE